MTVNRYSHCFTKCQLEFIIDSYLSLRPYYLILLQILKNYTIKYEQKIDMHNCDKPHPVRIYGRDYQCSKNILQDFGELMKTRGSQGKFSQLHGTYASAGVKYFYLYPLETVVELLESQQFYKLLPKEIIINNLLTTTNIQIIIEALIIVSEDMSKKIKSTIAGKQIKDKHDCISQRELIQERKLSEQEQKTKEERDSKDEEEREDMKDEDKEKAVEVMELQTVMEVEEHENILQSKINIDDLFGMEDDSDLQVIVLPDIKQKKQVTYQIKQRRGQRMKTDKIVSRLVKTQLAATYMHFDQYPEKDCSFCQNYIMYLSEVNGDNFTDQTLNKLSRQATRCLKIISQTIAHFTLYLMQTNQTLIPNDIHIVNRVLNAVGIVITEDIYASELNPKNVKGNQSSNYPVILKPKNLLQDLQPYFWTVDYKNKKRNQAFYSLQELFRMVVYCPSTEQVANQLRNYQKQVFEKQSRALKSTQKQERVKQLLRKQCQQMNVYEQQRLQIMQNTVNIKPIFKQLQFEQQQITAPGTTPHNYNVYNPTHNGSRAFTFINNRSSPMDRTNTVGITHSNVNSPIFKNQNVSVMMELTNSLSKIYESGQKIETKEEKGKKKIKKNAKDYQKPIKKMKMILEHEEIINSNQVFSTISTSLKKNKIVNNLANSNSTNSKSFIPSQLEHPITSSAIKDSECEQQLSDQQFKKILYTAYMKRHGVYKQTSNGSNSHPNPIQNGQNIAGNLSRSMLLKKNNGYSNSLSQLIGRKQQLEQLQCMQKKQKEIYNKQLLNGQFIKHQIYQEIRMGTAKVYEDYLATQTLNDSIRLQCIQVSFNDSARADEAGKHCIKQRKQMNVIEENSTKFNHTGLIRNEKYNKSIKNQLINHRQSYLMVNQQQNKSKYWLSQTHKQMKEKNVKIIDGEIKLKYKEELDRHMRKKH